MQRIVDALIAVQHKPEGHHFSRAKTSNLSWLIDFKLKHSFVNVFCFTNRVTDESSCFKRKFKFNRVIYGSFILLKIKVISFSMVNAELLPLPTFSEQIASHFALLRRPSLQYSETSYEVILKPPSRLIPLSRLYH